MSLFARMPTSITQNNSDNLSPYLQIIITIQMLSTEKRGRQCS